MYAGTGMHKCDGREIVVGIYVTAIDRARRHYRAWMSCTCPIESTPECSVGPCMVGSPYMPGWWPMWPLCAIIMAGCGCPGNNMACEGSGGPRRCPYDAAAGDAPYRSEADKSCIPAAHKHQSFHCTSCSRINVISKGQFNPLKPNVIIWLHFEVLRHKGLTYSIFNLWHWALWRSGLSARVPECQKLKM